MKKSKVIRAKARTLNVSIVKDETTTGLSHDDDFHQWTRDQIRLLKKQEFAKLDIKNLIEEIESLGNSEKNAIESYLIVLFLHLLKIEYQPAMRCNSWNNSVENAKFRIKRLVEKNPSLKKKVSDLMPDAYFSARLQASSETGLDTKTFPEKCPWSSKELFPELNKNLKKK